MPASDISSILTYRPTAVVAVAATAALTSSIVLTLALSRNSKPIPRTIIPSPRITLLPRLSPTQIESLGYPPNALPGARDVSTPFGSMRVYEWGPEDGRRVVMIHGDATPSPMFGPLAEELVARGCRVLTFDSWGRGYTDTPSGIQHNSRLYMQQVLYAITSSPIQWTGDSTRFSLIGFSLGGAIALDFFGSHPSLIESLVLLGPAGLLRKLPSEYKSFYFQYPTLATTSKMRKVIGTTLGVDLRNKHGDSVATGAAEVEKGDEQKVQGFTPAQAVQFQYDHHAGHIESFLSTIQYGPIQNQVDIWGKACRIISGQAAPEDTPLYNGKILLICGADDTVIPPADNKEDLKMYLGEEGKHWEFDTMPGGHGFPFPEGASVGRRIAKFWGLSSTG